jgi:glycine/D-amino acid oxidase-like deaminating enzyme
MARPDFDVIIAGAGLAGATAAFTLAERHRVCLVDADRPGAGASGIAAGMVNPISGLRAKPAWRMEAAMEALERMMEAVEAQTFYDRRGVLRPARDDEQAGYFRESTRQFPSETAWLDAAEAQQVHPLIAAPHGALRVHTGGVVDTGRFIAALIDKGTARGLETARRTRIVGWKEEAGAVRVELAHTADGSRSTLTARRLVLALGAGVADFAALAALDLHLIKGQMIRLSRPPGAPPNLLPLSGYGYVIDDGTAFMAGSSYEHTFSDLAPSPAVTRRLHREAAHLIPRLARCRVLHTSVGVRVSVPRLRLPMVGPVPGSDAVWIVSGLGSKGLLMAPMIAEHLSDYFDDPTRIPPEMQVRVKSGG